MIADKQKTPLLITVGTAVVFILGGAAAYWFLTQRTGSSGEMPTGANIIPQDALMTVSVTTNETQWERLREFGTPETQAAFDQTLVSFRDRFLATNGFNYQEDIQPWVGQEITFAFLAQKTPAAASDSPTPPPAVVTGDQSVVMILPVANPLRAKQVLDKQASQNTTEWQKREYKGIQVQESRDPNASSFSTAVLEGRFLVVSNDPQAIDRTIDTHKGTPSLAATAGFGQALNQIQTASSFARIFVNVPEAAAFASTNSARPVPPEELAKLRQNQGIAATVSLESEGVRVRGISWLNPKSEKQHLVDNSANSMPSRLPVDTVMMVSGGNLQRLWQDYSQGAAANPVALINPEQMRLALSQTTGLNLDNDLLNWMGGEFSLSVVPSAQTTPGLLPLGFVFMVEASDRRAAEKALERLDGVMSDKYKFKVEEGKVGNLAVVNWQPTFPLSITRGWLDNQTAFLAVGAPITEAFTPKPQSPLAANPLYASTVPTDLEPNNGHFYIDMNRAFNDQTLALPIVPPNQQTWLKAINSLGVTAAVTSARTTRYDVFVNLKKGAKPTPLPPPALETPTSPVPEAESESTN
ncbi:MAG: DUF3352 domain-containing protein [Desertifilum sp. SIO1I2]|nr:DUF3352 domain-containing protein [Desertifilum sp. SIO1I2]